MKFKSFLLSSTLVLGALFNPPLAKANIAAVSILGQRLRLFSTSILIAQSVQSAADQGNTINLNGRQIAAAWEVRLDRIGIADLDLLQDLGVELLNTNDASQQPVQWFSDPDQTPLSLKTWHDGQHRHLDITDLAQAKGWILEVTGNTLQINLPPSQVLALRHGPQTWGDRVVVDLAQPAAVSLQEQPGSFTVTLDGSAAAGVLSGFATQPGVLLDQLQATSNGQQTVIRGQIDRSARVRLSTLPNPNRIVIDIRADALVPRDILWAPGVRWRQQYVAVGGNPFPVYSVEADLRQPNLSLRSIWTEPSTISGITPLITLANQWQAAIAINGGFFNRNNRHPLGAIRHDNQWISGPILGRGAIAWNDAGDLYFGRLALQQSLTTSNGQQFPINAVNSGYVQAGIGLYTPTWGATYTPILDNETVVVVANDQVVKHQAGGTAGHLAITIPQDGYLLATRAYSTAVNALPPGTQIERTTATVPDAFEAYPEIMGGGPLLVANRTIVLSAQTEQFSQAFATQSAPRSAVGKTADGQLMIVTVHHRPGGSGPSLHQLADIMVQLGCTDALNLDGGSSSSLYFAGTLLNRDPQTAARVNNGLGLFLAP
ncbi:MAG: phosphodiester glycosidase family protein [Cyanobacteria bacterium P01_A01_bin.123]